MKQYFVLGESTPVYLYGAASIGKIVFERNPKLNICGFLDKRAEEIGEFMGLPVYSIPQAVENIREKNAVIMLSVKNVFELEDIAVRLYEAGFDKLIYKSRAVLEGAGDDGEKKLSEIWELLISGEYRPHSEKLPCFRENINYMFTDQAVLFENEEDVTANIPVELIYTNDRRDKWSDLNIQGYFPHIYFFYYLSGHKNGQMEDYLRFTEETALVQGDIKITEAWKRNVLRNRSEIYENMRLKLDLDFSFFHRNAPTAKWNEKGYFNLNSGKHRCAFLVSQGYRFIALRIKKQDYTKFLFFEDAENIRKSIVKEYIHSLETKVYHPWFYSYSCKEPIYYSQFQVEVLCRTVRMADKCERKVKVYTNLDRENSLFRLMARCRLVHIAENTNDADIVLWDEIMSKEKVPETEGLTAHIWCIGRKISGNVIAEYYSEHGTVYFYEKK